MFSAISYLFGHFFYHIWEFLRHWYVRSLKMYAGWVIDRLEEVDYYLAWRETARHFFEPLYKDYSILGRMLEIIFRTARIVIGSLLYLCIFVVAISIYLIWVFIPPYLTLRILFGQL